MSRARWSYLVTACMAGVVAVLTGILAAFVAGRWSWGLAVAVLSLVVVVVAVAGGGVKAVMAVRGGRDSSPAVSTTTPGPNVNTVPVPGGAGSPDPPGVSAGGQTPSGTGRVHVGAVVAIAVAATLVVVMAVGTAVLARQPGGIFSDPVSTQSPAVTAASPLLSGSAASSVDVGTPTATVRRFIDATFTERDAPAAAALTCSSPRLDGLDKLLRDLVEAEERYGVLAQVSVTDIDESTRLDTASVTSSLRILVSGEPDGSTRSSQRWRFELSRQQRWLVCAAARTS